MAKSRTALLCECASSFKAWAASELASVRPVVAVRIGRSERNGIVLPKRVAIRGESSSSSKTRTSKARSRTSVSTTLSYPWRYLFGLTRVVSNLIGSVKLKTMCAECEGSVSLSLPLSLTRSSHFLSSECSILPSADIGQHLGFVPIQLEVWGVHNRCQV